MATLSIWFFLLSLLFFLSRETRTSGDVAMHIQAGSQPYSESLPVGDPNKCPAGTSPAGHFTDQPSSKAVTAPS